MTSSTTARPPSFLRSLALFLRVEYLAFAVMLPLYGAFSVSSRVTLPQLGWLLVTVFLFHIYVCVLNDIMDLDLDKTQPLRAQYPLVRGVIQPSTALLVALLPIPIVYYLVYLQNGSLWAFVGITVGFVMMGIYNIWGKKTRVPLLIDIIQGVGFAGITLYGADIVGEPGRLTLFVFLAVVLWMVHTNLYGGFRDVETDSAFGLYTSPIMFGIKRHGSGMSIPKIAMYYSLFVEAIMISLAAIILILNDFGYPPITRTIMLIVTGLLACLILFTTISFFGIAARSYDNMLVVGKMIFGITGALFLVLFVPMINIWLVILLTIAFFSTFHSYSAKPILQYWRSND
jgi:4-hydroxybenzoate polyprenyltransferase